MFRYLLDTNIVSNLIRQPAGPVAQRIAEQGEESVCISVVVAAELRYGAEKSGSVALRTRIELLLSALQVLPLEPPVDAVYGRLRHHLTMTGHPIGPNDLLIAAHALTMEMTLVTANTREFERVPGLSIENWLAET
jgi:tRNA(fMet)-specific endonuclease VapC